VSEFSEFVWCFNIDISVVIHVSGALSSIFSYIVSLNSDGSDVEYKPDVTDIEQNICIQDTNVLSTENNIKTYSLINSFKVENTYL
jgi:hypothetical protein